MPRKPTPRKLTLNDDVIAEILIRLPTQSLARFKCVSKRWHSLASDPHLIRMHSMRDNICSISGFFFSDDRHHTQYLPIHGQPPGLSASALSFLRGSGSGTAGRLTVKSSCNGLILCSRANQFLTKEPFLVVCNPTTMEYVEIPKPDVLQPIYFGLAFDPWKSPHFKVVIIANSFHIYSYETRSWKTATAQASIHMLLGRCQNLNVYWNGMLLWATCRNSLFSYNVEGDSVCTLPIPPVRRTVFCRCRYLGESRRRLHTIWSTRPVETMAEFDIFEMAPDCSGWSVLYHVDLNAIQELYPEATVNPGFSRCMRCHCHGRLLTSRLALLPFCVLRGGEGEENLLLLGTPRKVICYHLQQKMFKEVCNVSFPLYGPGCPMFEDYWCKFHPYSHSVSSL